MVDPDYINGMSSADGYGDYDSEINDTYRTQVSSQEQYQQKKETSMKLGISIKIDVTKIDKSRIHVGEKGKYVDLTTFIDTDNPGQYGDHGIIAQSLSKEEREQGKQLPILGNCKVFFKKESDIEKQESAPELPPSFPADDSIDDIPF
jgi:hypothetical protein